MKYHEPGRPPGAVSGGGNRRRRTVTTPPLPLLQEWELRDRYQHYDDDMRQQQQQQYLVEEVESDEDEMIDGAYALDHRDRTPTRTRGGMYDGNAMIHEGGAFEQDYYFSDEEPRRYSPPTSRDRDREMEREREDALMQSAYARIARAREKGKTNVNLTQEEMQALERGRMMEGRRTSGPHQALERRTIQLPEPSSALATPPITPAAAISSKTKDKFKTTSSRSSSAASLASAKKSGRKSVGLIAASPAKSNSKAKVTRKGSISSEQQPPVVESFPQAPPGMRLVNGPHGIPVYAPVEYPSMSGRGSPSMSRSRSGSQHRRDSMTPPRGGEYPPSSISTRYRPGSSSSLRDDGELPYDWYGPGVAGRQRSVSNARSYQNLPYGYEYGERPIGRQQGDHYTEPVRYASLRRAPPMPTTNAGRERVLQRVPTNGSSDSSEGSEEQGVRVEVSAVEGGGYAVRREDAVEVEEPEVVSDGKKKAKGKDSSKYGSVRKRKVGRK